jgi:quinol monooxygenase YgiN
MKIKPECLEEVWPTVETLVEETRKEEGVLRYDWYQDSKEKSTFVIMESFKDMEAFKHHASTIFVKESVEKFKQWAVETPEIRELKPLYVAKQ